MCHKPTSAELLNHLIGVREERGGNLSGPSGEAFFHLIQINSDRFAVWFIENAVRSARSKQRAN
jgi:hypothetical protein